MTTTRTPRPSMRVAINAKCKDCIYDSKSGLGTWREQVGQCPCTGCPLYPVRPLPERRAPKNAQEGPSLAATGQADTEGGPTLLDSVNTVISLASGGQDDR